MRYSPMASSTVSYSNLCRMARHHPRRYLFSGISMHSIVYSM